ncbi:uncharacterized protein PG986_007183 [Apiospora aurea]|uniref:Uncharacterized protein n=1 Tax=Apiospora aurea TaxID=335848 RepID=A0ABR1QBW8_9PEZI
MTAQVSQEQAQVAGEERRGLDGKQQQQQQKPRRVKPHDLSSPDVRLDYVACMPSCMIGETGLRKAPNDAAS